MTRAARILLAIVLLAYLAAGAVLLSSCGGGGGSSATTDPTGARLWLDNSANTGDWIDGGVLRHSSPTPIERLNAMVSIRNVDHAINGLQLRELLAGGPVAMSVPPGLPVVALAEQLKADPSPYVVLGLGEVEALFIPGYSRLDHINDLIEAVRVVREAGKTAEIRGLIRFAPSSLITAEMIARRDEFDQARRSYARVMNIAFYDIGSVPFYGAADVRPDLLHPNDAYHQRKAEYIAGVQRAARVPLY